MKFGYPGGDIENEYKEVCELLINRCTGNPNTATPGNWLYGGWTPVQIAAFKVVMKSGSKSRVRVQLLGFGSSIGYNQGVARGVATATPYIKLGRS